MGLFDIVKGNRVDGMLQKFGDRAEAYVTKSDRKVLKVRTNGGKTKYSATQYSNGTLVETRTTKR